MVQSAGDRRTVRKAKVEAKPIGIESSTWEWRPKSLQVFPPRPAWPSLRKFAAKVFWAVLQRKRRDAALGAALGAFCFDFLVRFRSVSVESKSKSGDSGVGRGFRGVLLFCRRRRGSIVMDGHAQLVLHRRGFQDLRAMRLAFPPIPRVGRALLRAVRCVLRCPGCTRTRRAADRPATGEEENGT
jgi:hypothetical protein